MEDMGILEYSIEELVGVEGAECYEMKVDNGTGEISYHHITTSM